MTLFFFFAYPSESNLFNVTNKTRDNGIGKNLFFISPCHEKCSPFLATNPSLNVYERALSALFSTLPLPARAILGLIQPNRLTEIVKIGIVIKPYKHGYIEISKT